MELRWRLAVAAIILSACGQTAARQDQPAATGGSSSASGEAGAGGVGDLPAGAGGQADQPEPAIDRSWALWPMPNRVSFGLPNPASYDASVPGVVTDNVTRLVWQQEPLPTLRFAEAETYCADLALAGDTDWRMPTRIELVSLMAVEVGSEGFPLEEILRQGHWSSSRFPSDVDPESVWSVVTFASWPATIDSNTSAPVRCVRSGGPVPAEPHYAITPDVVHDTWTGLFWERAARDVWTGVDESFAYCAALSLGGQDEWRVPTVAEMLTIFDEHQIWPSVDPEMFPGIETVLNGWYWTASTYPELDPRFNDRPGVRAADGGGLSQHPTNPLLARCVR